MYELKITGFKTKKQAEQFRDWYSGQGEQDAAIWFECRKSEGNLDVEYMHTKSFSDWNNDTLGMEIEPQ